MSSDTPTATDALRDRKQILDENALLIQQRDLLKMEVMQYQGALSAVVEELKAKGALSESHIGVHNTVMGILTEQRGDALRKVVSLEGHHGKLTDEIPILEAKKASLTQEISDHEKKRELMEGEASQVATDHNAKKASLDRELAGISEDLKIKKDELSTATTELATAREEAVQKKAWMLAEEKRLALKGRDLAIYEERLVAGWKKIDPNYVLVL